jgi:DNA polymerase I-like protein with 3'-5' exonuclease and polymerase domains
MHDGIYRSAYSFIPQATVVDIINRALAYGEQVLAPGVPILQVHDEIVVRVPEKDKLMVAKKLKRLLEYPIPIQGQPDLLIPADVTCGPNWWDQEEMEI